MLAITPKITRANVLEDLWNWITGQEPETLSSEGVSNETVTYTPSSETHCKEGTCTLTLYSGSKYVYEDEKWKKVEEARSLKTAWKKVYLNKGDFDIDFIDYNYTCLLYTSPSPRDRQRSRMPSSA